MIWIILIGIYLLAAVVFGFSVIKKISELRDYQVLILLAIWPVTLIAMFIYND